MSVGGQHFFVGPAEAPDKFRLLRSVGAGGEGELWKAEMDLAGGAEPVAIKILHTDHQDVAAWRQRWSEQVDVLRLVNHPSVVGVHLHFEGPRMHPRGQADPGSHALYLVMNWIDGPTLAEWVAAHPGPEHRVDVLRYLAQVASVLDYLHSKGAPSGREVIHGDISPSNVIINPDGQAVLVDFGLFRVARHVTAVGAGTRGYCAPEVEHGGQYSPASDRYAFGGLAYFALTGTHPPSDRTALRDGLAILAGSSELDVGVDELASIFAEDPQQRPSAGQWLRLLRMHTTGRIRTGPMAPVAGGYPMAAVAGANPSTGSQNPLTVVATAGVLITSVVMVVATAALLFPRTGAGTGTAGLGLGNIVDPSAAETGPKIIPSPSTPSPTRKPPPTEGVRADLGELQRISGAEDLIPGAMTVDGVEYKSVMVSERANDCELELEFQLSKRYISFHSQIGISDLAYTGSAVRYDVTVDGVVRASKTVGLFRVETIEASLIGAQRMTISYVAQGDRCPDTGFIDPYVVRGGAA